MPLPLPSGEVAARSADGEGASKRAATLATPSQSPAVTAPPKGEPSRIPACTRNRMLLPLPSGEVAARSADGEGVCKRAATFATPSQSPAVTAPPMGGAKPHFHLHPQQEVLASPHGRGGNAAGIDGEGVCRGRCPSSPHLIQTNNRIGAFLPLPTGEVAARSADGEGEFFTILHSQLQPRRMFCYNGMYEREWTRTG